MNWNDYPNFKREEFAHGGPEMSPIFMSKLQAARLIARNEAHKLGLSDVPFIISSGSRSIERNRRVGGKPDSPHLYGRACDIGYTGSRECYLIVKSLLLAGFTRIGISKNFIHVDDGELITEITKDHSVIWLY